MGKYDDLNSVLLEGRLVRDPDLKEFSDQNMVCNFSIANNYSYKMKDGNYKSEATFIDIKVWGRSGQLCNQYLKKGSIVRLRGKITQDRWEDDKGQKRTRIFVTAGHVEFRQTNSTTDKKNESIQNKEESSREVTLSAKDIIYKKKEESESKNNKQSQDATFTKILPNKEGELPKELSNGKYGNIPF